MIRLSRASGTTSTRGGKTCRAFSPSRNTTCHKKNRNNRQCLLREGKPMGPTPCQDRTKLCRMRSFSKLLGAAAIISRRGFNSASAVRPSLSRKVLQAFKLIPIPESGYFSKYLNQPEMESKINIQQSQVGTRLGLSATEAIAGVRIEDFHRDVIIVEFVITQSDIDVECEKIAILSQEFLVDISGILMQARGKENVEAQRNVIKNSGQQAIPGDGLVDSEQRRGRADPRWPRSTPDGAT
jgi:hypothetical protein